MQTQAVYQTPSFSIFKAPDSKEKVESLIHCFMERRIINLDNPPATIRANDGWVYTCVYDSKFHVPLYEKAEVECIISYQNHTYGRYAIIRQAKKDCGKEQQRKLL